MKKSRVEDMFNDIDFDIDDIESEANDEHDGAADFESTADYGTDDYEVIDELLQDESVKPSKRKKSNGVQNKKSEKKVTLFGEVLRDLKQHHRSRGRKSKLKFIASILLVSLVLTIVIVTIWNSAKMKEIEHIADTIDNTYNVQELNIDKVQQLGNLFTIHDETSFNWVMEHIDMTEDVKSSLFTSDTNGKYKYNGTNSNSTPTYQCLEVQYEKSENPLSYLANFKVTLANGSVRYFLVTCKFRPTTNGKYILSGFYAY